MNTLLKEKTDEFSDTILKRIMEIIDVNTSRDKKVDLAKIIHANLKNIFDNINLNLENENLLYGDNNFLTFFNGLKNNVVEFGFYGIENLNYYYPLNKLSINALSNISETEKNGVKYKFCSEIIINNNEFFLTNLENIDILENIIIFDRQNNFNNFKIEICKDNIKKDNFLSLEKTLPIYILFNYKIILDISSISIDNIFYIEAIAYTFFDSCKNQLQKYY